MPDSDKKHGLQVRATALVAATVVLLISVWQIRLLYAEVAPFHQRYLVATPAQNASVTNRLYIAFVTLPLVAVLLCIATGGVGAVWTRGGLRIVAGACFVTGLHGWFVWSRLPYGFGSSYEHASAAQHFHLKLATTTGVAGLLLAAVLLVSSFLLVSRRHRAPLPSTNGRTA